MVMMMMMTMMTMVTMVMMMTSISPPPSSNNVINFGEKLNFPDFIVLQTGSKKQKASSWIEMASTNFTLSAEKPNQEYVGAPLNNQTNIIR